MILRRQAVNRFPVMPQMWQIQPVGIWSVGSFSLRPASHWAANCGSASSPPGLKRAGYSGCILCHAWMLSSSCVEGRPKVDPFRPPARLARSGSSHGLLKLRLSFLSGISACRPRSLA